MTESAAEREERSNSATSLLKRSGRYFIIIIFALVALAVIIYPLQHVITLGRYQHWGLSITCLGVGYLLPVIWSWKEYTKWARISYFTTAVYFLFVGFTFYSNPWLDTRMSLQTDRQAAMRQLLVIVYFVMSLVLSGVWMKWIRAEAKMQKNKAK